MGHKDRVDAGDCAVDNDEPAIKNNIQIHDKIHRGYEQRHGEIFNPIEQERLRRGLLRAESSIRTAPSTKRALDFGCGTGNLTSYLVGMGLQTVSADISLKFLQLIRERHGHSGLSTTEQLNGRNLSQFDDNTFDLVVSYSVLHHVPDYLLIVREMLRVLRPGGVLYIDHELNPAYWRGDSYAYQQFQSLVSTRTWKRFLSPRTYLRLLKPEWYVVKYRRFRDPRYQEEGDIHVWPDDHVDWGLVEEIVIQSGASILVKEDYLLYWSHYPVSLFEQHRDKCSDMRLLIAQKA